MFADKAAADFLGGLSIGCWIVVYSPQIIENYKLKSGDGLAVAFVFVWLVGDITNLIGAILGNLLPTMIALGAWYTFCDIVLLVQIYYYRSLKRGKEIAQRHINGDVFEETPLLAASSDAPATSNRTLYAQYMTALIFVIISGFLAMKFSRRRDEDTFIPGQPDKWLNTEIQVLGWTSAVMYLGSRIPQIIHNFSTRCEGLSVAMFLFAIGGNVTYSASILAESLEYDYLVKNASWLAGSALTVFLDIFVLSQFAYYQLYASRSVANEEEVEA